MQRRTFRDQDPVNIEASELIARLHDALKASGYEGHDLELFLVRTVFCLFADDTGIFEPRDIFLDFIEERTAADGSDLGPWLMRLFQVLDTAPNRRQAKLDEDLARFPHVNGDLFDGAVRIPDFDTEMRRALLDAGQFDWTAISPAIFGALFQSVMEPADRRAQGAHYTTEKNILKVIEPLFLDDLRAEFQRLQARLDGHSVADLRRFQKKLGALRLFDPACGCGNFLIIAYRELRALEIEVLRELAARRGPAAARGVRGRALGGRRRSVLRHRDRRVPGPHRRDRAVDDGPHHEQSAEPGVSARPTRESRSRSRRTSATPTHWRSTGPTCCRLTSAHTYSAIHPSAGPSSSRPTSGRRCAAWPRSAAAAVRLTT